jgi:hypothetical protein
MEKFECKVCHATAEIDQSKHLTAYNVRYPSETGPYSNRGTPHNCPIKQGLVPPQIAQHPNAREVR